MAKQGHSHAIVPRMCRIKTETSSLVLLMVMLNVVKIAYGTMVAKSIIRANSNIPQHIYPFQMTTNSYLSGSISCQSGSANYQGFLYPNGANLVSTTSYIRSFTSQTLCSQTISYTSPISTKYFLKVYSSSNSFLTTKYNQYELDIRKVTPSSNSYFDYSYTGSLQKNYPYFSTYRYEKKSTQSCVSDFIIEYYPPNGIHTQIVVQVPSRTGNITFVVNQTSSFSNVTQFVISNISNAGNWTIKVVYNTSSVYLNLTPYSLMFYMVANITQCQQMCNSSAHYRWYPSNLECIYDEQNQEDEQDIDDEQFYNQVNQQKSQKPNVGLIVGSIVGGVLLIAILLVIFFIYRQRAVLRVDHVQSAGRGPQKIEFTEIQISQQDLQTKISQCAVCLQPDCNSMLECNHFFHLKCIVQWLKRNRKCPFCRKETSIRKVVRIIK